MIPTCGSGSLLLRVAREAKVSDFYGQEMNRTTYNLARMNMILHGVSYSNFDIRQEDTLENLNIVIKHLMLLLPTLLFLQNGVPTNYIYLMKGFHNMVN